MKSAAVTENGENRAGALTRRLTCWFMRMRLPFCMVAKDPLALRTGLGAAEAWLVFPQERSGETASPELTARAENAVAGRKLRTERAEVIHG